MEDFFDEFTDIPEGMAEIIARKLAGVASTEDQAWLDHWALYHPRKELFRRLKEPMRPKPEMEALYPKPEQVDRVYKRLTKLLGL